MEIQENHVPSVPNHQRGSPLKNRFYKIDRYPYKNLPYFELFHEWPSQFLDQTNSNVPQAQNFNELILNQPVCESRTSLHIYTDASEINDRYSIAFHSPHHSEILG